MVRGVTRWRACQGRITPSGKLIIIPGRGAGTVGSKPDGATARPAAVRYNCQLSPDSGILVTDKGAQLSFSDNARKWKEGTPGRRLSFRWCPHI